MNEKVTHCVMNSARSAFRIFDIGKKIEIRESIPLDRYTKNTASTGSVPASGGSPLVHNFCG